MDQRGGRSKIELINQQLRVKLHQKLFLLYVKRKKKR